MKELFHLNKDIREFEKVIIYGSLNSAHNIFYKLFQYDVKVECFVDSDPQKCGICFMNIPVRHIDDLPEEFTDAAVVLCGRYAVDIAYALMKRGFTNLFLDYGNEFDITHLKTE